MSSIKKTLKKRIYLIIYIWFVFFVRFLMFGPGLFLFWVLLAGVLRALGLEEEVLPPQATTAAAAAKVNVSNNSAPKPVPAGIPAANSTAKTTAAHANSTVGVPDGVLLELTMRSSRMPVIGQAPIRTCAYAVSRWRLRREDAESPFPAIQSVPLRRAAGTSQEALPGTSLPEESVPTVSLPVAASAAAVVIQSVPSGPCLAEPKQHLPQASDLVAPLSAAAKEPVLPFEANAPIDWCKPCLTPADLGDIGPRTDLFHRVRVVMPLFVGRAEAPAAEERALHLINIDTTVFQQWALCTVDQSGGKTNVQSSALWAGYIEKPDPDVAQVVSVFEVLRGMLRVLKDKASESYEDALAQGLRQNYFMSNLPGDDASSVLFVMLDVKDAVRRNILGTPMKCDIPRYSLGSFANLLCAQPPRDDLDAHNLHLAFNGVYRIYSDPRPAETASPQMRVYDDAESTEFGPLASVMLTGQEEGFLDFLNNFVREAFC